jgi:ribosomal protein L16/L10AE
VAKGWTFQSLIDDKMTVTAYCHNPACHHKRELDLRAANGMGHPAEASLQEVRGQ